jgi:hypothetical protein
MATQEEPFLGACAKHFTERAVDRCSDCDDLFCAECLVPPTRRRMPVRCVDCALVAAGVRAPGQRRNSMMSMNRAQKRPTNLW